jgi:hypothetical protein
MVVVEGLLDYDRLTVGSTASVVGPGINIKYSRTQKYSSRCSHRIILPSNSCDGIGRLLDSIYTKSFIICTVIARLIGPSSFMALALCSPKCSSGIIEINFDFIASALAVLLSFRVFETQVTMPKRTSSGAFAVLPRRLPQVMGCGEPLQTIMLS